MKNIRVGSFAVLKDTKKISEGLELEIGTILTVASVKIVDEKTLLVLVIKGNRYNVLDINSFEYFDSVGEAILFSDNLVQNSLSEMTKEETGQYIKDLEKKVLDLEKIIETQKEDLSFLNFSCDLLEDRNLVFSNIIEGLETELESLKNIEPIDTEEKKIDSDEPNVQSIEGTLENLDVEYQEKNEEENSSTNVGYGSREEYDEE